MARGWQFASFDGWREPYQTVHGLNLVELLISADLPEEDEPALAPGNPPYRPLHHQDDPRPPGPKTDPSSPGEAPGPQTFPDIWQA